MRTLVAAAAGALLLSGCSQLSLLGFQKSEHSAVKDNRLALFVIQKKAGNPDLDEVYGLVRGDANLDEILRNNCEFQPSVKAASVAIGPVAAALGKLLFDLFMDNQVRQVEGLKKAAQGSYADRRLVPAGQLRNESCVLALRYKQNEPEYGLAMVLQLNGQTDKRSFVLQPLYVRARNSVVVTEKSADASKPDTIAISIAMSLKAIPKARPGGVPSLQSLGEAVVSIPKVALGPQSVAANCYVTPPCPASDLVPYPEQDNDLVSVTLGIAEVGKIGFDLDQSIAELKAVKEALGPVLRDTLKEALKE